MFKTAQAWTGSYDTEQEMIYKWRNRGREVTGVVQGLTERSRQGQKSPNFQLQTFNPLLVFHSMMCFIVHISCVKFYTPNY